jgi:uncharacterized protein YjbI with pentapeptide repeats
MTGTKIDPFDVNALERAVNDSATRVSAIWVSFLVFSLYLFIAATTVTPRQLLLAEPIKLPVVNVDLPLWGFFVLAPILFVIFHTYVLIQVLLLGRTTAAYNIAVARQKLAADDNALLRQRLANTLFAQIFGGSPREREGFIGWLLRAIVWITLAVGPILIVLAFQISFLPYHSHIATWTHRILILIELAAFFLIWPLALDATKDIQWRGTRRQPLRKRLRKLLWFSTRNTSALLSCALFILISLSLVSFPGEPHVNLFTGQSLYSVNCKRTILTEFNLVDLRRFDRLVLPNIDVVDDEKLEKIKNAGKQKSVVPFQTERVRDFSDRDFRCASFSQADLRHVAFDSAHLAGANLSFAELQGASFRNAILNNADMRLAKLDGASLSGASLRGASLHSADARGAVFADTRLEGATLDFASAFGANFTDAHMMGISMTNTWSPGADFSGAQLQGANLERADFSAAFFGGANLQGSSLIGANLRASYFNKTQLNGAILDGSQLGEAEFFKVALWRAKVDQCKRLRIDEPDFRSGPTALPEKSEYRQYDYSPLELSQFIERTLASVPETQSGKLKDILRDRLTENVDESEDRRLEEIWKGCGTAAPPPVEHRANQVAYIVKLVCSSDEPHLTSSIVTIWTGYWMESYDAVRAKEVARGLLGYDNKPCAGASQIDRLSHRMLLGIAESGSN